MSKLSKELCEILIVVVDINATDYYSTSHPERMQMRDWVKEYGNVVIIFANKEARFIKRTSANNNAEYLLNALINIKEEYANYIRTATYLGIDGDKIENFILDKFKRVSIPYDTWLSDGRPHFNAIIKYIYLLKDETV